MATSTNPLLCSICLSEFKSPKILSCFHSFCKDCLSSYLDKWASNGSFNCPLCRCHVDVPGGGVDEFRTNFYIPVDRERSDAIRAPVTERDEALRAPVRDRDEGSTDVQKTEVVKDVDVTNRVTSDHGDSTEQAKCTEHKRDLDLFCRDCAVPICNKCLLCKHKQHDFVDVEEVAMETRMKIKEFKKELEEKTLEMSNFTRSVSEKISQLGSDKDGGCLKVDKLVGEICRVAKQLGADVKRELHLTSEADESQMKDSLHDDKRGLLKENLDIISRIDDMKSVNALLNMHQKVNSDIKGIRSWNFEEPNLFSPCLLAKINVENFYEMMKRYLGFRVKGEKPNAIQHLLRVQELESRMSYVVGKCILVTKLFKARSLNNMLPLYSDDTQKYNTKWYTSLSIPRNSNKIWISLFFSGSRNKMFRSLTARFVLKLVNRVNEEKSRRKRGMKIFYPPKGLVTDCYDWKDVIDIKELSEGTNGFLHRSHRVKVVAEITILSFDLY